MLVPGGRFTGVEDTGQVEGLETPDPVREGVDPLRLVNARILFTVQLLSINQIYRRQGSDYSKDIISRTLNYVLKELK